MRIGIEGQRLFRKEKHGMDIVAMELIKNLQCIDEVNEYYIFVKEGEDDQWYEPTKNFHIIRSKKAAYHIWEQFILPKEAHKYKIEILHCTSNTAPMFLHLPLVLTLHDIIYLENFKFVSYKSTLYQLIGNFYRRWVAPRILRKAKRIITVSNTERSTIIQKYPELREKLRVVYNAVGTSFQNSDPKLLEKIKKKYELPDKFIFCLGNTSPKKNLSNILKAYYLYLEKSKEKLPLVLADHSPGDLFLFLNSNQSQHKENLKFIGYIRNSEMPYLYQLSHLFLYPSIRESFGIPILESMKMSTPVITSNISCMPEIAGRGAYYADPFDENSIATAMEELLQNPTLYKSMVDRGHQRVAEFSWRESAKKLLEIYENVYAESYPKKLKTKNKKL